MAEGRSLDHFVSAYGIGLEIAVADLDACRGILSRNGVTAAAGTILEFVQA